MNKAVIFSLLIFSYSGFAHAEPEIPIAKRQAIDKLMQTTETAKNMRLGLPLVIHEIFQTLKTEHPSLGVGILAHRDHRFWSIVTSHSGAS